MNLIQGKEFDIRKFAEALERNAQEAVKWERRKLEWILEQKQESDRDGENQEAA